MEMISPSQYRENNKDKSIDELVTLKKQLEEDIDNLSKTENDNSLFLSDTRLPMKKEYLAEISKLIDEKTNNNEEVQKKISFEHYDLPIPSQEKNLKKISQLLDEPIANVQLNSKRVSEVNATYYYNPTRGGKSIIVSDDGTYLATGSSTSFERLLEEFNNGRRNGNFNENSMIFEYIYDSQRIPMGSDLNSLDITLNNNTLTLVLNNKEKVLKDKSIINEFEKIVIKYKDKLLYFSDLQSNSDEFSSNNLMMGGPTEQIYGMIDNKEINIYGGFNNKELNEMFKSIYLEVNDFIKENGNNIVDNIDFENINVVELSAIIRQGPPTPRQRENIVLLVSDDYAVIDNNRYDLSKTNKQEIDNLIKNSYSELKKIFEEQTPEFLSSHIAYNNTSKTFNLKLSNEEMKISYQTGTESDNKIKKLIDDITSLVFSKINNSNEFKNIIDNIFSGLTGDKEKDFEYLNKKTEEYKDHPLAKEIAREIGRKLYDILPDESKEQINDAYSKDMDNINKMLKEVESYIFSENKDLEKAKSILLDFIQGSLTYDNDSETEYYNFSDVIDFALYTRINKTTKNIKWIDVPFVTAYSYLAYIYNEQKNYDEALKMIDKTIRWSPMNLSPLFEKCETYKLQKNWEEFKNITSSIYDKIYNASDLAHYYRNLGYYYIEMNNLDLAYALYTASIKFEKSKNVYREMAYINQQLKRENYNMLVDEGLKLLQDNGIAFGPKQENLNRLTDLYTSEKELIKNPSVEMQLAERIYYLTLDKRFAPFFELVDKTTGCSIIIPRSWSPVKEEVRKEQFGSRNMFAVYTDYNSLFQANYDGKCSQEQFNDAYQANINNMVNHKTLNLKLLNEGTLTLKLQQGMKDFKHALFDMKLDDRVIRIMHYFTIVNGIFADFSITLDEKIDYKDNEKFNNQKGMRDIVNLLANIIELKAQDSSQKDKTIDNNISDSEIITHNIMFSENLNFNIDFPKELGQLSHPNDTSFKIGNVITIMNAKCNSEELLSKRSKEWLQNSTKTNGQTILDDLDNEYSLKNNSVKVVEKTITKDNKNRYYKFIYFNQTMLIFGYNNKELSRKIDDAIISLKSIIKQEKIQRDPFEKPNNSEKLLKRKEIADKFYGYHSKNSIGTKNMVLDYLNLIKDYLKNYEFKSNHNFVFCGRKKFIYDEINNALNGSQKEKEPLYFVLGSLEEFMSNDNFINVSETNYVEVKAKNDEYIKNGYICLEEKNYIDNIIKAIEEYISNNGEPTNVKLKNDSNKDNLVGDYSQEELKELYYKQMTEEELDKIKELDLDTEIKKIINPNYQIKYIDSVGYIFIGEGYLILKDGTEPTHYFVKIFDTDEKAKQEILKEYNEKIKKDSINENKVEISNNNVNEIVLEIVNKIKTLPDNIETTIAQLLQLSNEEVALVDPMTQGTIFNLIEEQCKTLKIRIEVNRDEIGGLAYHYKFKKETMDAYKQPFKPINLEDLIKNISPDPFWQTNIKKYFDNLNKTNGEKVEFLQNIILDKQTLNNFTKDINSSVNPNDIYDKYIKILNSQNNDR